jgi:hypothetical protein
MPITLQHLQCSAVVDDASRDQSHELLYVVQCLNAMTGREVKQEVGVNHLGLLPHPFVAMTFADPNCSELSSELAARSLVEQVAKPREQFSISIITSKSSTPMNDEVGVQRSTDLVGER